jgi:hypothetical protein
MFGLGANLNLRHVPVGRERRPGCSGKLRREDSSMVAARIEDRLELLGRSEPVRVK